eukprot:scaffold762_cov363-Pavlova_lutheri.AAC.87
MVSDTDVMQSPDGKMHSSIAPTREVVLATSMCNAMLVNQPPLLIPIVLNAAAPPSEEHGPGLLFLVPSLERVCFALFTTQTRSFGHLAMAPLVGSLTTCTRKRVEVRDVRVIWKECERNARTTSGRRCA